MPYQKPTTEKVFYSIGEVARMFDATTSQIRFWEKEFDFLTPHKNKKGNRLFTKDDVEKVRLIYQLVKEKGMTLRGAQKKLKENPEETLDNLDMIQRLQHIRQELLSIRDELNDLP